MALGFERLRSGTKPSAEPVLALPEVHISQASRTVAEASIGLVAADLEQQGLHPLVVQGRYESVDPNKKGAMVDTFAVFVQNRWLEGQGITRYKGVRAEVAEGGVRFYSTQKYWQEIEATSGYHLKYGREKRKLAPAELAQLAMEQATLLITPVQEQTQGFPK